jgi:multidrug efflux system membrane fusion protein
MKLLFGIGFRCPVCLVSVVLAGLLFLGGCSRGNGSTTGPRAEAPAPVRIAVAARKALPVQVRTFGTVETYATVDVKAQVTGELTGIFLTEGEEVKTGDLLFTLDARPLEAVLKQAEANLAKDKTLAQNAVAEEERAANLLKENVFTQQQYDNAHASALALAAAADADAAAVENVKTQLAYCTIRSPITGRAGSIVIDKGNIVKANDSVGLVVINQIKPIYVSFSLPEQQLPVVRKYMAAGRIEVEAFIPNDTGPPLVGVLSFIDNAVDSATGMIRLKAVFPNVDERLWPGLFVNVAITLTTEPDAIVIPVDAIQVGQQGQYVFTVKEDDTAELRPVVVRRTVDSEAVIERGIQPGDKVVTDGQFHLVTGTKVQVMTEGAAAAGSGGATSSGVASPGADASTGSRGKNASASAPAASSPDLSTGGGSGGVVHPTGGEARP